MIEQVLSCGNNNEAFLNDLNVIMLSWTFFIIRLIIDRKKVNSSKVL